MAENGYVKQRTLDPVDAVLIVTGMAEAGEAETLQAWQYLVNTGLAWQLEGSIGRQAAALIEAGLISPPAGAEPEAEAERSLGSEAPDEAGGELYSRYAEYNESHRAEAEADFWGEDLHGPRGNEPEIDEIVYDQDGNVLNGQDDIDALWDQVVELERRTEVHQHEHFEVRTCRDRRLFAIVAKPHVLQWRWLPREVASEIEAAIYDWTRRGYRQADHGEEV